MPVVPSSPHDALVKKIDMGEILHMSKPLQHSSILTFNDIKDVFIFYKIGYILWYSS